jgi:demethylmenaquinone methyltransferase/2-methoxy-6-polyprenyl-1,4-benzoquinol methylase
VHYDRSSQLLSIGSGRFYRRFVLTRAGLAAGMRVLDVASGTGLVARAAAGLVRDTAGIVALEPSSGMIAAGRKLTAVPFVRGVADALPFASEHFDLLTMGYALRHVSDVGSAFREFFRVLRPGGRVVVLEISQPVSRVGRRVAGWYLGRVLPRVTRLATRSDDAELMMRYYWETIASCVSPATIMTAMRGAGFDEVHRTVYFGMCSEYYGTKR